jgi:serine/arginine repetitive matrix protein 2
VCCTSKGYDSDQNQVASPHSQSQHHGAGSTNGLQHQINTSKANALLESVVDSIQSPQNQSRSSPPRNVVAEDPPDLEYSNSNRRNRDLAEAIFGSQEAVRKGPPTMLNLAQDVTVPSIVVDHSPDLTSATGTHFPSQATDSAVPALNHLRARPTPLRAQSPAEQNALAEEVQRKADAATASLRRISDIGGSQEGLRAPAPTGRKRINPHQISEPKLVSSSASVDTIPLTSPGTPAQQSLWIGDRFRKLRGTLRGKPTTSRHDEEGASYPGDSRATGTSPLARQDSTSTSTNAAEPGGLKPSGSISAGPGFKGLLGRLRRPRTSNPPMDFDIRSTTQVHSVNTSISSASQPRAETPENFDSTPTQETSAPSASRRRHPLADPDSAEDEHDLNGSATETEETVARKVFLNAALSLGLDEEAVKELLARKASSSSQAPRKATTPMVLRPVTVNPSLRASSPKPSIGNSKGNVLAQGMNGSSMEGHTPRNDEFSAVPTARNPSSRRRADPHEDRQGNVNNAVVRRTIIFPSDAGVDLNALMRKSSQSKNRRRSSSGGSARSSRSVHDRAPTPPPPRSPSAKRFSRDSPPVPRLPPSFAAQGENMIQSPASSPATGPIEKSSSTYDSLYVFDTICSFHYAHKHQV